LFHLNIRIILKGSWKFLYQARNPEFAERINKLAYADQNSWSGVTIELSDRSSNWKALWKNLDWTQEANSGLEACVIRTSRKDRVLGEWDQGRWQKIIWNDARKGGWNQGLNGCIPR